MNKKITTILLSTLLAFSANTHAESSDKPDTNTMNSIMQTMLLENFINTYNKSVSKDFNVVNLNIEESQSVMEDYLEVTLKVYEEGENRENVQKALLAKYNTGVEKIKIISMKNDSSINTKKEKLFEVKNTYFRVYPQEQYNRKDGTLEKTIWKGEGVITLGGRDIEQVSEIATNLNGFTIFSNKMMVSENLKNKTMTELQSRTINSFKERAKLLSKDLGFEGQFTIKELNVSYVNASPSVQPKRMAMAMMAESSNFDTSNESISTIPGEVNISAFINGSIILGDLSSNIIKIEQ